MKTRPLIYWSGTAMAIAAFASGNATLGAVIISTTMIMYMLHTLEVKVNKLLDEKDIRLSQRDLDD